MLPLRRLGIWFVLLYLKFWAKFALAIGRPTVIGIAGSVGKSSTKQALYAMLKNHRKVAFTEGNSETGVPLGILGLSIQLHSTLDWLLAMLRAPLAITHLVGCQVLLVEMATDDPYPPKNMDYLLSIVQPDIAIWLNTFPIHTEQFSKLLDQIAPDRLASWTEEQKADFTTQSLAAEDAKIITHNPSVVAIYNTDNHRVVEQLVERLTDEPWQKMYCFGTQEDADIQYGQYTITPQGTTFELQIQGQSHTIEVATYLLPQVYQEVLAAALLAGLHLQIDPADLISSFQQHFQLPAGRSTVFAGVNQSIIIDSTYNSAAASVTSLLTMANQLKQQTGLPLIAVLGDMREMGPSTASEHTAIAQAAIQSADQVVLVGPLTQQYCAPIIQASNIPVQWFATSDQLAQAYQQNPPASSLILAKGSQNTIYLEEALKPLLQSPDDAARLCRQEPFWLARKAKFFAQSQADTVRQQPQSPSDQASTTSQSDQLDPNA